MKLYLILLFIAFLFTASWVGKVMQLRNYDAEPVVKTSNSCYHKHGGVWRQLEKTGLASIC